MHLAIRKRFAILVTLTASLGGKQWSWGSKQWSWGEF